MIYFQLCLLPEIDVSDVNPCKDIIRDRSLFTGNTGLQKGILGYGNFQHLL